MPNTFAFVESRGAEVRKVGLEAVTAARAFADKSGGGEVHALLIGPPGIAAKAPQLGQYGADVVITVQFRNPVRPVGARLRAHPVTVAAGCQLRQPHDRDQPQDPMSVHPCVSVYVVRLDEPIVGVSCAKGVNVPRIS